MVCSHYKIKFCSSRLVGKINKIDIMNELISNNSLYHSIQPIQNIQPVQNI